jgi:hypothetical protein
VGVNRGRLNRVEIQLTSAEEPIVVSWDTREQILGRLTASQDYVADVFRDVGASNPVMLSIDEKRELLLMIDKWRKDVGARKLPDGVVALRKGLRNDIRAAELGR